MLIVSDSKQDLMKSRKNSSAAACLVKALKQCESHWWVMNHVLGLFVWAFVCGGELSCFGGRDRTINRIVILKLQNYEMCVYVLERERQTKREQVQLAKAAHLSRQPSHTVIHTHRTSGSGLSCVVAVSSVSRGRLSRPTITSSPSI